MNQILNFLRTYPFGYNNDIAIIASIIGTFLFVVYLYACYCNYGFTKSISITYYFVKPRWLFQAFMWTSIFCIGCIGQNYLYFIVCLLFSIMTCNPSVNSGNIYFIPHMIGATSAIVIGLIGLPITYGNSFVAFPICTLLQIIFHYFVVYKKNKNTNIIYWIEIYSLLNLLLGFMNGVYIK